MKDLEVNKIVASVLVAALIALASGKLAGVLYHSDGNHEGDEKRGFSVEVATGDDAGVEVVEEEIDIAALIAAADSTEGAKNFKKCASCHGVEPGGSNKVGPNLANIVGADKAHHADYAYSDAIKAMGGKWSEEDLYHFINKPRKFMPGTKMTFAGISRPDQIANIIAFLKENSK